MLYLSSENTDILPLRKCLQFLQCAQLPSPGSTVELGDGIRCIGGSYETLPETEAVWEAHKKFVDLHCVLCGEEKIGIAHVDKCKAGAYNEKEDFYLAQAEAENWVTMKQGVALCLFPEDVHQVKVRTEPLKPERIDKVVFKIPVELFKGVKM